ncbi:MAG: MgtC/SapB family protein [Dongiaceae bacterium]
MTEVETFARLGLALALGLLIGLERGWEGREAAEHSRVAGIRTFGLIGFGGGLAAQLFPPAWSVNFGLAFAALAIAIAAGHYVAAQRTGDLSATGAIAALATFILGATAVAGSAEVAASAAVIIALLLSVKPILHGWLERIEYGELLAALQLLLISVVALPLLPDRGFGPWQALNPFELWWMVVLITAFSFCGYLAMRIVGPARGTMITAILGGLTSSTAVTVSLARLARRNPGRDDLLAAGAAVASGTMFLRTMALLALLNLPLLLTLAAPLGAAAAITYGGGLWLWQRSKAAEAVDGLKLGNPFELWTAVKFGSFLAVVMVAVRAGEDWIGPKGVLAVAALSGLADVDAVSLSMARLGGAGQTLTIAALAIGAATSVNSAVKAGIAVIAGTRIMAYRLLAIFAAATVGAAIAAILQQTLHF